MQRPLYIGSCRHVKFAAAVLRTIAWFLLRGPIRSACNAYSCVIYGRDERRSANREKKNTSVPQHREKSSIRARSNKLGDTARVGAPEALVCTLFVST
jgi:hypothetical protein